MKRASALANTASALRGALLHALVFVTLFAFAFQGFLTQTHIHAVTGGKVAALADLLDGATAPGKAPAKSDPANCPLCQQIASSGNFVTPAAAAIFVPFLTVSVITVVSLPRHDLTFVSHAWRGRGPPHA
jgi:hypothetical protein